MAQTITVNREVSVTSGHGNPPGGTLSRAASTASAATRDHTQLSAGLRPRAKSASNLLNSQDQRVRFHDDTDTLTQQQFTGQDGLSELIDFLRNHAPPSDNFMSIPDGADGEDKRRWSMLRRLSKKRGQPKAPPQIRLPDSAVSGVTIGGHRHIAISIPLAASPFGQHPRSQYPVYQYRSFKPITAQYAPTRAILNEKGVVTVLRGITEGHELTPPTPIPRNPSPYRLIAASERPHDVAVDTRSPTAPANANNQASVSEDSNPIMGSLWTPPPGDDTQSSKPPNGTQRDYTVGLKPSYPVNHQGSFPARGSSINGGRVEENSIDAVISREPNSQQDEPAASDHLQDDFRRQSLSKSIITTSENDPIIADAEEVKTSMSTPLLVSTPLLSPTKAESPDITVITQSPFALKKPAGSPAPSICSTQSRREKVREKKKRDMEAVRRASVQRQKQTQRSDDGKDAPHPPAKSELRPKSVENGKPRGQRRRSPPDMSLCPIMVVTDVRPSPIKEEPAPKPPSEEPVGKTLQTSEQATSGNNTLSRASTLTPAVKVNGLVNPTSPQSSQGSPRHRQKSADRTSLSRRREWNACRKQEREVREQDEKAQESKDAAVKEKARKMVPDEQKEESKLPPMEQEVLRRYEAYREYRIREMERRVRRLERNGDVWLRALVPVLDSLNRTLANAHEERPRRVPGWMSDDDSSACEGRGRSIGYRQQQNERDRGVRRSVPSERQFLEKLARKREEMAAGSGSDDMSGLETIEPLMRELAGRSRLSFEAKRNMGSD